MSKHQHHFHPYEYFPHHEEEKLHCMFLATLICECGKIKPVIKEKK